MQIIHFLLSVPEANLEHCVLLVTGVFIAKVIESIFSDIRCKYFRFGEFGQFIVHIVYTSRKRLGYLE